MLQSLVHYSLHLVFPALIAVVFYRKHWKVVWLIFLATMMVDLDHLFALPIFDPNRCSIGFHPLHSYIAIAVYSLLLLDKRVRVLGIGLLLHMATDYLDCLWMNW